MVGHDSSSEHFAIHCDCCVSFQQWKKNYPYKSSQLQKIADKALYYQAFPNEKVNMKPPMLVL